MNRPLGIGDFIASFKGDTPGHPFRGNQYDGGDSSSVDSAGSKFHSDLSAAISGYGENGVKVSRGFDTETHHQYIVRSESPTVKKRLEGKLQRRLTHGGLASIEHLDQRSFMIKVPKDKLAELYRRQT